MAVVAALALEDAVAAGHPAGEPQRAHGRLGARRHEADLLDGGVGLLHQLGEVDLGLARRPEAGTARGLLLDRLDDVGVTVAEDGRAPGADVVDVAVVVGVVEVGALGLLDEQRVAADAAEGADGGVDAAHERGVGALEQRSRGIAAHRELLSMRAHGDRGAGVGRRRPHCLPQRGHRAPPGGSPSWTAGAPRLAGRRGGLRRVGSPRGTGPSRIERVPAEREQR
jgi:hypothetical protein